MNNSRISKKQILKNLLPVLSLIFLFSSCNMQQAPVHENVDETVIALEKEALDQWASGNPAGFPMHAADDVTYIDDIAAQNRIVGIEAVNTYAAALDGQIPPHSYEIVDPLVQVYGDVAILTFQYHSKIDTMSGPPWKATSIYHFNDTVWQMVHANWSLLKVE